MVSSFEYSYNFSSDSIQTAIWTLLFSECYFIPTTSFTGAIVTNVSAPNYMTAHVLIIINEALYACRDINLENAWTIPATLHMVVGNILLPVVPQNNQDTIQIMAVSRYLVPLCREPCAPNFVIPYGDMPTLLNVRGPPVLIPK